MDSTSKLTRRRALGLGGASLATLALPAGASAAARATHTKLHHRRGSLPVGAIQDILQAEGTVSAGVLAVDIARKDVGEVKGPFGLTFPPSFQVDGSLTFQPLGGNLAFFNGDLALKASELNHVIDAIHANDLVFQAMHQHFFDLDPLPWFIHFRGLGDPRKLAHAVRKVLAATSTPLPQKKPTNPTTPLDHGKLAKTLHGSGDVGEDGVVTVTVNRSERIIVGSVQASPEANISSNIQFLPLNASGSKVAAAPDFGMRSDEVGPVTRRMRALGWEIGCLYNQETDEHPQLYFSHMIKVGDPQKLAVEIRKGLDLTNSD